MYCPMQNTQQSENPKFTYQWNPLTNSMVKPVCDKSVDDQDDFKKSLDFALKNLKIPSCKRSQNSESTTETKNKLLIDLGCKKYTKKIKGVECEYNSLITHNQGKEESHFRILNKNVKTLLEKKRKPEVVIDHRPGPKKEKKFNNEVPTPDLKQIVTSKPQILNDTYPLSKISINTLNEWLESEPSSVNSNSTPEPLNQTIVETNDQKHVIPDKFRNKKLPYLDKRIRTGYIKFFDEKNHFGFMNLTSEPYGEVFIFGKEFEKSKIDRKFISIACNNPDITFKFRIMYYEGKHGESKKAVNLRL